MVDYVILSYLLFGTHCHGVVVITHYWSSKHFTTNESVDRTRNLESNASQNDQEEYFSCEDVPQANFLRGKNAPQARLIQQNAAQARFFD